MAAKKMEMILTMVFVATTLKGAAAQYSCSTVIISLSTCLDYVTGNSITPSSACCSQFANVVQSQPQCLRQVINGGSSSLGININQTQALALPRLPQLADAMEMDQRLYHQQEEIRQMEVLSSCHFLPSVFLLIASYASIFTTI